MKSLTLIGELSTFTRGAILKKLALVTAHNLAAGRAPTHADMQPENQ